MKKPYLAAHDYGMGSVWAIIYAGSGEEILRKYPQLKLFETRPDWMTEDLYNIIISKNIFDIDEPTGWLAELVKNRNS